MAKCVELDPSLNGEFARGDVQVSRIADVDKVIYAVEQKSSINQTRGKGRAVLQRAIVTVLNIFGIAIARPPANHTRWRRSARLFYKIVRASGREVGRVAVRAG